MTYLRNAVAAISLTALVASPAFVHAQEKKWGTVGQAVTLTSCVEKGHRADTFILTHVADVPVHPATMGKVVYWLDSVKELRKHVGHQVRVIGAITEVKQGEMEVKAGDDSKGGWYVEIEGPGKDVETTPSKAGVESTAGRQSGKNDVKTTLVRLKVNEITMVAASCPTM